MNYIKKYPIIAFFVLTLLWSDGIWISMWVLAIPRFQLQHLLHIHVSGTFGLLGLIGPGLAAIVISLLLDGKKTLFRLFKPLAKWKVPYIYYVYVYLGVFFFYCAASWFAVLLGNYSNIHTLSWLLQNTKAPLFELHGLWIIVEMTIIYTFCEELGWRGFALPRMTEKINVFSSAFILGVFWTLWHIPMIYLYGSSANLNFTTMVIYFLHTECMSIFFAWFYFKTNRSLLICGLFHGAANGIGAFFPMTASLIGQGSNVTTLSFEIVIALLMIPYLYKLNCSQNRPAS
ncbi:MAG: CPBP family intramembrane glutamic endopeptidase [Gammaproteobacteria bacterium]|jgi:membrane protease YdiL (CAAX protease family)